MKPTGKNLEQFEKWYTTVFCQKIEKFGDEIGLEQLYKLDIKFQIGVYLAYYDSLGIHITSEPINWSPDDELEWLYSVEFKDGGYDGCCKSRNEAYKEALKRADGIRNKNK